MFAYVVLSFYVGTVVVVIIW